MVKYEGHISSMGGEAFIREGVEEGAVCAEKGICDPHNLYDPNIAHEKVINTSVFQADFFLFSMQQEIEKK